MAIQELDLKILHHSGKHSANIVLVSPTNGDVCEHSTSRWGGGCSCPHGLRQTQNFLWCLSVWRQGFYLEDETAAKRQAMTESQYLIQDKVLYHIEGDGTLSVILQPSTTRKSSRKPMEDIQ